MSIYTNPFTPAAGPALVDRIADGAESAITMTQAARLPELCVDGRPMNVAKLYRAASRPIRGVLLDTTPIAGRLVTTRPAVRRWLRALNENRPTQSTPAGTTPRRQQAVARRAHANAMSELARAGLVMGGGRR